jgi:hypothetical protein
MNVYGVDYYVSFTPEAAEKANETEGFTEIAVTDPFHIFELPETQLVETATHVPSVYQVPDRGILSSLAGSGTVTGEDGEPLPSFHDLSLEWYEDVENMDRWVVADGPEEWPRIEALEERADIELEAPADAVSDIEIEDHRISFSTEAVGIPHLVKVSYFPNWSATGAEGPWRASPSLMVVLPTQEDVVLEFQDTWAETGGKILTLLGVAALVAVGVSWWRRRVNSSGADPAS